MNQKKTEPFLVVPMTPDVLSDLSWLHMRGFKEALNTQLGKCYVYACIAWFCRLDGGVALVAKTHSNRPLGYLVGAPLGYSNNMTRDLLWVAARAVCIRPWLLLRPQFRSIVKIKLAAIFKKARGPEGPVDLPLPTMSLVGLVVDPQFQRQQIGKQLIEAFEARARELGFRSIRLSVYPENIAARRVYEKCAWVPYAASISPGKAMYYYKVLP